MARGTPFGRPPAPRVPAATVTWHAGEGLAAGQGPRPVRAGPAFRRQGDTMSFRAVVSDGTGPAVLREMDDEELPAGDVTVEVAYSSLNYKDGLAVTGRGRIARRTPMVCGIDLAGTVTESSSPRWHPGDEVVCTGWGLSETHPGGYTTRQRLDGEWLVGRPRGLDLARTMAIGTAGLTAMLCVLALEDAGLSRRAEGEVLVTGAAGGVGSVAVSLLAALGYRVAASTGR